MTNPALQAALASFNQEAPPAEAPAEAQPAETAEAAETPPAEGEAAAPPPAPPEVPPLSELETLARQRQAEREAQERSQAERQELETLRQQVAALAAGRPSGIDPQAFLSNPLGTLRKAGLDDAGIRDVLKGLTTGILNPDVQALAQEVRELKTKAPTSDETLAKRLEAIERQNQEAARMKAESDFDSLVSSAEKFPLLSRLSRQERIQYGWDVVGRYAAAGIQVSDEQVAMAAEQELKARIEKLTGAVPGAQGAPQKNPAAQAASNGRPPGGQSLTLSSDLSANAATAVPETLQDRIALAIRNLEHRRAAGE